MALGHWLNNYLGGGGSGGSGGGVDPLIVTFAPSGEGPVHGDKTFSEIFDAAVAGRLVIGKLVVPGTRGLTSIMSMLNCDLSSSTYYTTFASGSDGAVILFESNGSASESPSISMG